jgi:hypothetical protein
MSEIDRVFARFREDKPAPDDRRETLNIPRRGGAHGSRVVEVVHLRSGGEAAGKDRPRRTDTRLRAYTWEDGFPARQAPQPGPAPELPHTPTTAPGQAPTAHVMPMWEPAAPAAEATPVMAAEPPASPPRRRAAPVQASGRRVADPFDAADEGANCMRCGYAVEPARERRGLMTCAACG